MRVPELSWSRFERVIHGLIARRKAGELYEVRSDGGMLSVRIGQWDGLHVLSSGEAEKILESGELFVDYFKRRLFPKTRIE